MEQLKRIIAFTESNNPSSINGQPLIKKQHVEMVEGYFNSFQNGNMEHILKLISPTLLYL